MHLRNLHVQKEIRNMNRFIGRTLSSETSSDLDIQWISQGDSVAQNQQLVSSV